MTEFRRPALPGAAHFEAQSDSTDPAAMADAGHRIATLLVRGAHHEEDQGLVDRVVHLADNEGLADIADLWSHAAPDTVAGALWRLYVLRTWVHRQPDEAAREFAAGKAYAPVHEVLAGVVDPPGPAEVIELVDAVVSGIVGDHFDIALDRAASFAHIVGVGRSQIETSDARSAARLVDMAAQLHRAAEVERSRGLP